LEWEDACLELVSFVQAKERSSRAKKNSGHFSSSWGQIGVEGVHIPTPSGLFGCKITMTGMPL